MREGTGRSERFTLKGDGGRDGRNLEGPWGPIEGFDEIERRAKDESPPGDADRARELSEGGLDGRLGASRWSGSESCNSSGSVSRLPAEYRGESTGSTTRIFSSPDSADAGEWGDSRVKPITSPVESMDCASGEPSAADDSGRRVTPSPR